MVRMFKNLLTLTQEAKKFAEVGDFQKLGKIIAQREDVLKKIDSCSSLQLSAEDSELVKDMILSVNELDKEIALLLQQEMADLSQEISEVITQLKVLSDYSAGISSGGRFDTTL